MNIFNTQNMQVKGEGAKASGSNVLDVLGNHKHLTPEQVKALQKAGKLKGDTSEFETLLGNAQGKAKTTGTAKNQLAKEQINQKNALGQKQLGQQALGQQVQGLKYHNKDIMNQPVGEQIQPNKMPQQAWKGQPLTGKQDLAGLAQKTNVTKNHQVTPQGETKVARVLKLGQSKNLKATQNNPNVTAAQLAGNNMPQMAQIDQSKNAMMNMGQASAQQTVSKQAAVQNTNPNLVDFKTFMMKQNPQARKRIATKSAMYQSKDQSMFNKKVEDSLPGVVKKPTAQVKLQDVMFNHQNEGMQAGLDQNMYNQNMQTMIKGVAAVAGTEQMAKVFDMNQMSQINNTDSEALISKIQDYAIQTKFSNEPQLDFTFRHQDLGQVDLMIQKGMGDELNIIVGANTADAAKFFTQHKGELLQNLTQAGIQVGDFKLDSSARSNNQNLSQNSNGNGQDTHREHQSESGQREHERQRRSELWDQFADKEAA